MSYCIGYLYTGSVSADSCIDVLYIGILNYMSITITGGFEGIVCFFGMVCFSGMGYVVDSNYICGLIIFCRRNHIARIANSDFSNIGRFTQYAASCE